MHPCRISVIIPVFNSVDFLPECMYSIEAQSFSDFEVIFSDDGSTDGSAALCDHFAEKYPSVSAIHLPNSGPGAARNAALSAAAGEYIFFMDSDDVIHPDALYRLLNMAEKTGSDLTVGDFMQTTPDQANLRENRWLAPEDLFFDHDQLMDAVEDYLRAPRGASFFTNVWGKLYRHDIIKKHNLAFDPNLKTWEDIVFNFQFLRVANSMSYLHDQLYDYRLHPDKPTCGSQLLNFPFGHRRVLAVIRDILTDAGREKKQVETMCLHADVYFAVKNLIVCYVLRSRGKIPAGFDMKTFIRHFTEDPDLMRALETYVPGENEDTRIPLFLKQKQVEQVDSACINKVKSLGIG